jgi:hypothetical protein
MAAQKEGKRNQAMKRRRTSVGPERPDVFTYGCHPGLFCGIPTPEALPIC